MPHIVKKYKIGYWNVFVLFFCSLFAVFGSLISINRFWQYETFHYDFGIFNQAIWNVSRLRPPIVEHFLVGGKWIFADHFNPSIFIFSPLYLFTERSEVILIAQAVFVAISGFILFLIGKKITKNPFISFTILFSYFLFVGLQNGVISDFHEATVATLPFMLVFLGIVYKIKPLYFLSLLVLLGFKESYYLLGIAIGITLFFLNKNWKKEAIFTIFISFVWGVVATKIIIPYFSGGTYLYTIPISMNPIDYVYSLFSNETKINTILKTFKSFGFLPVLSPQFYLLIIVDFLSRFYPPFLTLSWTLSLHYSAITSAIFGISSVFAVSKLQKKVSSKLITITGILLLINAIYSNNFFIHAPFGLAINQAFYRHSKNFEFLDILIKMVPENTTVMTTNNLAPHFKKQKVMLFREVKCKDCKEHYQIVMPQYLVVDFREGQNPNNWYGVGDFEKIRETIENDKKYKAIYKTSDQGVYKRI